MQLDWKLEALDEQSLFWVDTIDPPSWEASLELLPTSEEDPCTTVSSATGAQSESIGTGTSSGAVVLSELVILQGKHTHPCSAMVLIENLLPMQFEWESMSKIFLPCDLLLRQTDLSLACPIPEKYLCHWIVQSPFCWTYLYSAQIVCKYIQTAYDMCCFHRYIVFDC